MNTLGVPDFFPETTIFSVPSLATPVANSKVEPLLISKMFQFFPLGLENSNSNVYPFRFSGLHDHLYWW